MKRSPYRSSVSAMRSMSVASIPKPMISAIDGMILPDPGAHFVWRPTGCGPALICSAMDAVVTHFFTTRHWHLGQRAAGDGDESAWAEVAAAMTLGRDE